MSVLIVILFIALLYSGESKNYSSENIPSTQGNTIDISCFLGPDYYKILVYWEIGKSIHRWIVVADTCHSLKTDYRYEVPIFVDSNVTIISREYWFDKLSSEVCDEIIGMCG